MLYHRVHFFQYLYLNHFCRQVIRTDSSHILPYGHVAVDLAPSARIYVGGGDLELGCDALRENEGTWSREHPADP